MIASRTASRWPATDHFEPDDAVDPRVQRQLRGHLEKIDYTAYAANKQVISARLGNVDVAKFEALGLAAAQARADWVAAGLATTPAGAAPGTDAIGNLARLRAAYEELTEVYDAMRRMVERGYLVLAGT